MLAMDDPISLTTWASCQVLAQRAILRSHRDEAPFDGNDGETVTKLTVESYERNGKAGYAFSVQRGPESINVPVSGDRFLHAAEFLRHLSLAQAWVELPA